MPTLDSASGKLRRSIGIMGGTFDPIHHGHLVAASEVMDVFQLDQVIFVPTAMQPFKAGRKVTPAEHRYLMTVIATASNPRFSVSRVDIDRGGTTYTLDTLHDLRKIYPYWRCPQWQFLQPIAASVSNAESQCGIWCPMGLSNTSTNTGCISSPHAVVQLLDHRVLR